MEGYLKRIRELPFVLRAEAHLLSEEERIDKIIDARLTIETPQGDVGFLAIEKKSRLTLPVLRRIRHTLESSIEPCIV